MKQKKLRGRPKGTVIATDQKTLEAIADLIVREPALRPTTAIKRVVPNWTDTIVHRLLGKWRKSNAALLLDAQQRRKERRDSTSISTQSDSVYLLAELARLDANPVLRTARELGSSPALKAAREIMDSPTLRMIRQIQESPSVRLIRELQNSPTMQLWQAVGNNPIVQMARAQARIRNGERP